MIVVTHRSGYRRPPPEEWLSQTHVDLGALAQRVTGLENGHSEIRGAIGDLAKKLDAKPTNWWGVIGGVMAILTVIGGAIGFLITPVNGTLSRHEQDIAHWAQMTITRPEYVKDHEELIKWLESLRDRIRVNEDVSVSRREFDTMAKRLDEEVVTRTKSDEEATDRIEKSLERLEASVATRADFAESNRRTDDKVNMLASSLNEIRRDFYAAKQPAGVMPR